jgi:tRNA/rRNA methyltransferase
MSGLAGVVVVLVRAEGARNVGSVARLCGNFGAALRLVGVDVDVGSKDCLQMAHPCEELVMAAPRFATVTDALADCALAVATSGKIDDAMSGPPLDVKKAGELLPHADVAGERVALVFGNERTGLAKSEAAACQRLMRLPTPGPVDSLNLSHAVCVALTLCAAASTAASTSNSMAPRAKAAARSALLSTWNAALLARGFYDKGDPMLLQQRMAPRLQELVDKMDFSDRDVALVTDMLRHLGGASGAVPRKD